MKKVFILIIIVAMPCLVKAQGIWMNDSLPAFGMSHAHSEVIDGKIYVVSWGMVIIEPNEQYTKDSTALAIFDPVQHTWNYPKDSVPFKGNFAACSVAGKIYIIGAESDSLTHNLEVYDPTTDSWSIISYTGVFTPRSGLTASVVDGKIYAIGGNKNGKNLSTVEVFDPVTSLWSSPEIGGSFTARYGHTACVLEGKIYVMGGATMGFIGDLQIFDPAKNSWTTPSTTGVLTPRGELTSCVVNNKIYAIGGYNFAPKTNIVEVFDPVTNTWMTPVTTGTFTSRTGLSSSVMNNKIYTVGGYGFINSQHTTIFSPGNFNEVFTPSSNEVNSQPLAALSIFPNPTSGIIYVTGISPHIMGVSIDNTLGENILQYKNYQPDSALDLSKLVSGIYYIRFTSADGAVVKGIIRE